MAEQRCHSCIFFDSEKKWCNVFQSPTTPSDNCPAHTPKEKSDPSRQFALIYSEWLLLMELLNGRITALEYQQTIEQIRLLYNLPNSTPAPDPSS